MSTKESLLFRARALWLNEPVPYQDGRDIILIELRRWLDGEYTYHIGGIGRTNATDVGRERAQELLQKGGGVDMVERTDR